MIRFAMCALMPHLGEIPGVGDTGVREWVAQFRRESTWAIWLGVSIGSLFIFLFPLFTVGVPLPACWLPRSLLEKHVRRMAGTPIYLIRQPVFLVKMVAGLCWGSHPAVRQMLQLKPYPTDPGTWRTA